MFVQVDFPFSVMFQFICICRSHCAVSAWVVYKMHPGRFSCVASSNRKCFRRQDVCSALPCERDFCQEANFSWHFLHHRHPPSRHTLGVSVYVVTGFSVWTTLMISKTYY